MFMRRRRPLMRAAVVGGVAYHAGRRAQEGREQDDMTEARLEQLWRHNLLVTDNQANLLHFYTIEPGEVLVCEATSPNWTPAFAKIAACVCDGGGTLSHAAIVGREYGVPTVTAVGLATMVISDGDEVEVDGTTGRVTVLKQAPNGQG